MICWRANSWQPCAWVTRKMFFVMKILSQKLNFCDQAHGMTYTKDPSCGLTLFRRTKAVIIVLFYIILNISRPGNDHVTRSWLMRPGQRTRSRPLVVVRAYYWCSDFMAGTLPRSDELACLFSPGSVLMCTCGLQMEVKSFISCTLLV